ncbi:phosphoenolpyruvate mutase [Flavivirga spongiicola]|uniref:phosphoenolpyruvate mutase n=1 Tax=Flavivirga spongiicola TaxID=421621 RepID=A0ABU7XZN1_9FLAO|nr:phosphoenolpyruvate mutase [Flavivirga sp. MEBiC05379]MDO5980416.1 phosphoenolpyruvate mutase [Flavivirga sp. MEBiC05379]
MKTIYLGMTADAIHPGIINIINEGAKHGKVLVGLLTDKAIANHKPLPILDYNQRLKVISNIKGVYKVVPQNEWSYLPNLKTYKPDAIIHGDDWKSGSLFEIRKNVIEYMASVDGEVIEIPYTLGVNSSMIIENNRTIGTTPEIRLKSLRRLINAKPLVRILESHNGLTGLIIENLSIEKNDHILEFDGMWSSSLTDSTSKGKPDIETVDTTKRLSSLVDILECTTKPVIYDADTGGKLEHFPYTVRTLERNGVSAVIIEDKTGLKKNSLFGTSVLQKQESIEGFCKKIKAGKAGQVTKDFMIISRIESFILGKTVEDALERAHAYILAGANGIMIHSKHTTGDDIFDFVRQFRLKDKVTPIVVVPSTYNHVTEQEFIELGVNIVIYANHMLRAAYPSMVKVATMILEDQNSVRASEQCMSIKSILELIPGTK